MWFPSHRLPGYKLINTVSRPKWSEDQPKVVKALRKLKLAKKQYIADKLKTPLQVMDSIEEEEISKKVGEMWTRPPGGQSLVPETTAGEDAVTSDSGFQPIGGDNA